MKTVVSFLAAMALALGMSTFVAPATAAPAYPGTVRTQTTSSVQSTAKPQKPITLKYRVKANGNAAPVGQVKIEIFRVGKRGKLISVRTGSRDVNSNTQQETDLAGLPRGLYRVQVSFKAADGTVFKDSDAGKRTFRVKN